MSYDHKTMSFPHDAQQYPVSACMPSVWHHLKEERNAEMHQESHPQSLEKKESFPHKQIWKYRHKGKRVQYLGKKHFSLSNYKKKKNHNEIRS